MALPSGGSRLVRHHVGRDVALPALSSLRPAGVDPAAAVWLGLIAAALGWDVYLLHTEQRLLSDVARTRTGIAAQVLVAAHFAGLLGRFDPFVAASRRIPRRHT